MRKRGDNHTHCRHAAHAGNKRFVFAKSKGKCYSLERILRKKPSSISWNFLFHPSFNNHITYIYTINTVKNSPLAILFSRQPTYTLSKSFSPPFNITYSAPSSPQNAESYKLNWIQPRFTFKELTNLRYALPFRFRFEPSIIPHKVHTITQIIEYVTCYSSPCIVKSKYHP